jgi:hypothetical protein
MLRRALGCAAFVLLLVACGGAGKATPGPNAGHVFFGQSYDTSTFAISGATAQAPQGHDIAFVGHFTRRVAKGQIHVLAVINGITVLQQNVQVTNGPWTVYAGRIPGNRLFEPGPMLMRIVDDGNVLVSSGTLTVTPAASGSPGGSGASPLPGSPGAPASAGPPGAPASPGASGGGGGNPPSPN